MRGMDDSLTRIWNDLIARVGGPMSFRLALQPIMALVFAIHDGLKAAREGRPPYLWTVVTDPSWADRWALLREAWHAVAHVFLLAIVMDAIYQFIVRRWVYPGEALLVSFILAVVPYVLARGLANRLARWWWGPAGSPPRSVGPGGVA
jgi:hypothetical protein